MSNIFDAAILDNQALLRYADDPDVEFVEAAVDHVAPHGENTDEEKNAGVVQ